MKITKKDLPNCKIELRFEVTSETFAKLQSEALRELGKNLKVSGFRPGHVPADVAVHHLGPDQVLSHTFEKCAQQGFALALKQEKFHALDRPQFAMENHDPVTFTLTVDVLPEFEIPDLTKVKIPKVATQKISKKEIEQTKENLCQRFASLKKLDRAAKKGDLVEIDFQGFDESGVALDNTASKHHPVQIGSNAFVPGFEENLLGLKAGDKKEFVVTFPKDYSRQDFQNRKVKFKVQVHDVFEKVLPEFSDELAVQVLGAGKTAQDMEQDITTALAEKAAGESRQKAENEFLENLQKATKMQVPAILVERETDKMVADLQAQLAQQKVDWNEHLQHLKTDEQKLRNNLQKQAEKRVRTSLAFVRFLQKQEIEITENELNGAIALEIESWPKDQRQQAKKYFAKGQTGRLEIEQKIKGQKFFDRLFQKS